MRNRSHAAMCLLLALLVMLTGHGAAAAGQSALPPEEAMQGYQVVLLGVQGYLQCGQDGDASRVAYLSGEFLEWYGFEFDAPLRYEEFCVTDLDADGSPEVILKLSEDFGFEALRYEGGRVCGYPFVWRAMEKITASGELHGSNGADDYGWYQVRFENEMMKTIELCWKHPLENGGYRYLIGENEVTEKDFEALNDSLWEKAGPDWMAFTPENIGSY